ncbi:hypothetical protein [Mesorhizobium mediterraneum]|uniref:hypothetical protein n=1 Tax=Mesorhizobium mediterraneum TaxID=43617 RepID=UPI00177F4276|nr:hypothetical protein [Mesorhizobium mediterraneum]
MSGKEITRSLLNQITIAMLFDFTDQRAAMVVARDGGRVSEPALKIGDIHHKRMEIPTLSTAARNIRRVVDVFRFSGSECQS